MPIYGYNKLPQIEKYCFMFLILSLFNKVLFILTSIHKNANSLFVRENIFDAIYNKERGVKRKKACLQSCKCQELMLYCSCNCLIVDFFIFNDIKRMPIN